MKTVRAEPCTTSRGLVQHVSFILGPPPGRSYPVGRVGTTVCGRQGLDEIRYKHLHPIRSKTFVLRDLPRCTRCDAVVRSPVTP